MNELSDDVIREHLKAAPDAQVIRLTDSGRQRFVHDCTGWLWRDGGLIETDVTTPLCWTPDGKPPFVSFYYGRCKCGAIITSESVLRER